MFYNIPFLAVDLLIVASNLQLDRTIIFALI